MIADAMAGKIDMILTKSISRFARNTVDTLTTIRALKEKGVGVTFEKENIDTMDSKGELVITIMSSLAQEESRSISENTTWGKRKQASDGKVSVAYSSFLGYTKGSDGKMQIVEEEAKIVREIYAMFLDGKTQSGIAAILNERGIPTPAGGKAWTNSTIKSILQNEKYKGDALLQKSFTLDFLSKRVVRNCGEVPQYYVEKHHEPIVSDEVFDLVQYEMARRSRSGRHPTSNSVFSSRLICGDCGAYFGSKVWHSNDPYRCVIWQCNKKYEREEERCRTPHLREEELKAAFQDALKQMLVNRDQLMAAYDGIIAELTNTEKIERESAKAREKLDAIYDEMSRMVKRNAETALNQDEYNRKYDALTAQSETLKERLAKLNAQMAEKNDRRRRLGVFAERLKEIDDPSVFDEHVFAGTVEQVVVHKADKGKDKVLMFRFKDGTEITV